MTRDLPFDDDSAAGDDHSADTAYRVATGVARVARAGAYVTGGALVAAAGSRGQQSPINHDSRNVGWSEANDPQPELPSPTLTFPDLAAGAVHANYGGAGIAPVALPDNHERGTDAGFLPGRFGGTHSQASMSGFNGLGLPDSDSGAGFVMPTANSGTGFTIPGSDTDSGFTLPGAGQGDDSAEAGVPGENHAGFTLPGMEPGAGFTLPGMEPGAGFSLPGLKLPGTEGIHLPGMNSGGFAPGDDGHFQIPSLPQFEIPSLPGESDGGNLGVYIRTDWSVDAHVGLDGVHFESNLKVDIGICNVGHQLDQFQQDLGQGISHIPGATTPAAADQPFVGGVRPVDAATPVANAAAPQSNPVVVGAGAPSAPTPGVNGATVGGSAAPGASAGVGAPTFGPGAPAAPVMSAVPAAPIAPAPVAPAAPIVVAPVVPAAVPVAIAPVAVAQPVVTTPLQTTIQPDAAFQPIANVLHMPGQSPLTVPAAAAPALFEHARQPVLASNQPGTPDHSVSVIAKPLPVDPSTTVPTISVPTHPVLTTAPSLPTITKVPDPVTTKVPVITVPPVTTTHPPITTQPGVTTTPDLDVDITTRPSVPDTDDDFTPPTTVPGGGTTHQPTVSNPAHPTVTVPTVAPTVDVPTGQPTIEQPATVVPTVQPMTTQPKPLPDAPKPVKPVADVMDSNHHVMPIAADSGLHPVYLLHDGGLGSSLMPDSAFAETHYPAHGVHDFSLL